MKAKIGEPIQNDMILSVGMIVKNEENILAKTLEALKGITDHVSSELIIVDTGSTDSTVEIAKKYTDKVYPFEWTGDFAAARNFGLRKCRGEWFLFIDADEVFDEDVSELVEFLQNPEKRNAYHAGFYIIRNYSSHNSTSYSDFYAARLFRRTPNTVFKGKIHETITPMRPILYFQTIAHHYGYSFLNDDQRKQKAKRNFEPLFENYRKNPKDLRNLCQLCDSCIEENEKEKYAREALALARTMDINQNPYILEAFTNAINMEISKKNYEPALDLLNEIYTVIRKDSVYLCEIYEKKQAIYTELKQYQNACTAAEQYLDCYQRYENHELNMETVAIHPHPSLDPKRRIFVLNQYCTNLLHAGNKQKALDTWMEQHAENYPFISYRTALEQFEELFKAAKEYHTIRDFCLRVAATGNQDKIDVFNNLMEKLYFGSPDKQEYAQHLTAACAQDPDLVAGNSFLTLMDLISTKNKSAAFDARLQKLAVTLEWTPCMKDFIYLCAEREIDITPLVDRLTYETLREIFPILAEFHHQYPAVMLNYITPERFTGSIRQLLFAVSALETASLAGASLSDSKKRVLYHNFISMLADYVQNIYNPELLNPEDVGVLPPLHLFGYHMGQALQNRAAGDEIGYIREIKQALSVCEPMKDLVAFLLQDFEISIQRMK